MRTLDRPAPGWIVATCDWIASRWLCPQGLAMRWRCGTEQMLRGVFGQPALPITWRHILWGNYRLDCMRAEN